MTRLVPENILLAAVDQIVDRAIRTPGSTRRIDLSSLGKIMPRALIPARGGRLSVSRNFALDFTGIMSRNLPLILAREFGWRQFYLEDGGATVRRGVTDSLFWESLSPHFSPQGLASFWNSLVAGSGKTRSGTTGEATRSDAPRSNACELTHWDLFLLSLIDPGALERGLDLVSSPKADWCCSAFFLTRAPLRSRASMNKLFKAFSTPAAVPLATRFELVTTAANHFATLAKDLDETLRAVEACQAYRHVIIGGVTYFSADKPNIFAALSAPFDQERKLIELALSHWTGKGNLNYDDDRILANHASGIGLSSAMDEAAAACARASEVALLTN